MYHDAYHITTCIQRYISYHNICILLHWCIIIPQIARLHNLMADLGKMQYDLESLFIEQSDKRRNTTNQVSISEVFILQFIIFCNNKSDHKVPLTFQMVQTFSRCVLCCEVEVDLDELLATRLVSFLMDHHQEILQVPVYLQNAVQDHIDYLKKVQVGIKSIFLQQPVLAPSI